MAQNRTGVKVSYDLARFEVQYWKRVGDIEEAFSASMEVEEPTEDHLMSLVSAVKDLVEEGK